MENLPVDFDAIVIEIAVLVLMPVVLPWEAKAMVDQQQAVWVAV